MPQYRIGSFNADNLTNTIDKLTINPIHKYDHLANIVIREKIDILAIQEVMKPEALYPLVNRLGSDKWKCWHGNSPESGRRGDFGLGFIWNSTIIKECSADELPIVFRHKSSVDMTRKPVFARFTPEDTPNGGPPYEFRIINVHLCWSSEKSKDDRKKRIEEFNAVTGEIYEYIENHVYGDTRTSFTIIMGDYNLRQQDCNILEKQAKANVRTVQKQLTHISRKKGMYCNDLDHFSWDVSKLEGKGVDVKWRRVDTVNRKDYFNGSFDEHLKRLSDHVPIICTVSL